MTSHSPIAQRAPVPRSPLTTSPPEPGRDAWSRAVLSDRRLRSMSKVVAIHLSHCEIDPTYQDISKAVGCDRRTAMRAVARLVTCGWLEKNIASRGRIPNEFRRVMRVAS